MAAYAYKCSTQCLHAEGHPQAQENCIWKMVTSAAATMAPPRLRNKKVGYGYFALVVDVQGMMTDLQKLTYTQRCQAFQIKKRLKD